ncbi:unnamed protein product [Polarella glacialis]|uniref:Receptor ligand binding region domain-containing protein n=1 Tax=Polarella glacialis TaxID=89957 RepID=A0A813IAQ2_POLGL|nr:unnamed protein product [Polarella glacialis]
MARFLSSVVLATLSALQVVAAEEFALGIYGPITSVSNTFLATAVAFDIDFRKHFNASLQERFGAPIIQVTGGLHPALVNLTVRIGTSDSHPDVGVSTVLDFFLGRDGRTPISGLVGGLHSAISFPVASLAATFKVPQVAFASTSPKLSNKDAYPYFLRTMPPDSIQGSAFWQWLVHFQVPSAVFIYSMESYAEGMFQAVGSNAALAGQSYRVSGVGVRYMPVQYDEEARSALKLAMGVGTKFLLLVMTTDQSSSFFPVMRDEGVLTQDWQLLASQAVSVDAGGTSGFTKDDIPIGFMQFYPVSKGPKFPEFEKLWLQLTADDVIGMDASSRYNFDKLKVSLDSMRVRKVDDSFFSNTDLMMLEDPFLFDAAYTFVLAVNELLNEGKSLAQINGPVLLAKLKTNSFEGISGQVNFNADGDRLASYNLINMQPAPGGGRALVVAGMFDSATKLLSFVDDDPPYWMDGLRHDSPPDNLVTCAEGFTTEVGTGMCKPCPAGYYSPGGRGQQCSPCLRGSFAASSGSRNCTLCTQGSYAPEVGSSSCGLCVAGFFAEAPGQEGCSRCPVGRFVASSGASSCSPCGLKMVTAESGADSAGLCQCAAGSFFLRSSPASSLIESEGCTSCLEGLACPAGLGPPLQLPGFWAEVLDEQARDYSVVRCRNSWECNGGLLGSCADGRQGRACNSCKDGYHPLTDGTCGECAAQDSLPMVFLGLGVALLMTFMLIIVNSDLSKQSLNLLTIVAVASQLVMAVQALGAIRQLKIHWVEPVLSVLELTKLLNFDFDVVNFSCFYPSDDPVVKFVFQLLAYPFCVAVLGITWGISYLAKRPLKFDNVFNINGLVLFAFFITLTLTVLLPFQCVGNPNGTASMVTNPGITCYSSARHEGLVAVAVLGVLAYPVTIITWIGWTTMKYPSRVSSGMGLHLVQRYRFLFNRFHPHAYYYGLVLMIRNLFVAILPVALVSTPALQVVAMGALLLSSAVVQSRVWPWRTEAANLADATMSCFLVVVMLGAAPLLDLEQSETETTLGVLLCIAVFGPLLVAICAIAHAVYRRFSPASSYSVFLCHHKEGAGSLARWLKLQIGTHSSCRVFLDSDNLEDLDLIFDTVRSQTKNLVVLLTPELLKRMWCAGEIVTAHRNNISIVTVICDGFAHFIEQELENVPSFWTEQQKHTLASFGIDMDMVKEAYRHLQAIPCFTMPRFGSEKQQASSVLEIVNCCRLPKKAFSSSAGSGSSSANRPRILITGAMADAEALSVCQTFQILVQRNMQVQAAVVRSLEEMENALPFASYVVVLFSRGMLRDPNFALILLSANSLSGSASERKPELVTVSADAGFEFPGPEFYRELELQGLGLSDAAGSGPLGAEAGPELAQAYRSLLSVLALPLTPLGSIGLLEKQVSEICRRFRRYRDSATGLAMDQAADHTGHTGHGGSQSIAPPRSAKPSQGCAKQQEQQEESGKEDAATRATKVRRVTATL